MEVKLPCAGSLHSKRDGGVLKYVCVLFKWEWSRCMATSVMAPYNTCISGCSGYICSDKVPGVGLGKVKSMQLP